MRSFRRDVQWLWLVAVLSTSGHAQPTVATSYYNNARTGANLAETQLNTSDVSVSQFGKLFRYVVDGSIYAQPLYVPGVAIPGKGTHNVVYVATMNDSVYAFDADSNAGANASPLWQVNFTNPAAGITVPQIADIIGSNSLNIVGPVGIESTPVIDTGTRTMYLLARTRENGSFVQKLHALDITTGAEKFSGPVTIRASFTGTGTAAVNGVISFDGRTQNQRASLALANGSVYIAWSSHEDTDPYHGWVIGYNASTLQQTGVWVSTPDGARGSIWQSGRAPAVDAAGNLYAIVSNGDWNGTRNFGNSFIRLGTSGGLSLLDWFTPDNWADLNAQDLDLGSGGTMLIPGTNLLVGGGKAGVLYLVSTANMGHLQAGNRQIVQSFQASAGQIKPSTVYWNSAARGPLLYLWAEQDFLKAWHFNGTALDTTPVSQSKFGAPPGSPGGVLAVSANGGTAGSGILWASLPVDQNADHGVVPGVLRAFDASDLTRELWNSLQNSTRDDTGLFAKFVPPTVVNGKVYMASFSNYQVTNYLNVYGLLGSPGFTVAASPGLQQVAPGGSTAYQVTVSPQNGFSGTVALSVAGLPSGATAVFSPASVTGAGSSTMTVTTGSGTPAGDFTLTVTGTSGSLSQQAAVTLHVGTTPVGTPSAISVNFAGNGAVMAAGDLAGVVPLENWNNATGATSATPLSLRNQNGDPTLATIAWSCDMGWSLPIGTGTGNSRMMQGYLDTPNAAPTTVSVGGLAPAPNGYDIYLYTDGDNPAATRTSSYQIAGPGSPTTTVNATDPGGTNFSGTFTQAAGSAGNYIKFTIAGTAFTITARPVSSTDPYLRAPVNGIQIVPTAVAPGPDFTISATPGTRTVAPGGSAAYTVAVTGVNGFGGATGLSASGLPSGATATFAPASVAGTGSSTLTVTATAAVPAGNYTLTITGTSGGLVHTAQVGLTVGTAPPAGPAAISINFVGPGTPMAAGESAGVVPAANWNNAVGAASAAPLVLANAAGGATGATATWSSDHVWGVPIAANPGNPRMMQGYLDTVNNGTTTVALAGLPASTTGYDVYVYTDGDNPAGTRTGSYQIAGPGIATTPISATDPGGVNFSGSFTQAAGTPGNYVKFTIAGAAFTLTARPVSSTDPYLRAPVNGIQIVPAATPPASDFTVSATPATRALVPGGSASYTVMVTGLNGFGGSAILSAGGLPSGATAAFAPASVTVTGSSTLTVTTTATTPVGSYTLTITATSGSLIHTAQATLAVNAAPPPTPAPISINFVGRGTAMAASETAGVVPAVNWNNAAGAVSAAPLALVNATGSPTGATATWSCDLVWSLPIAGAPGNGHMMLGYLDTLNNSPTTVAVTGLPASAAGYDIYVYTDGDNPAATRTGAYQIAGAGIVTATITATDPGGTNFNGAFTQAAGTAGNYVKFTIAATGFTLTARPVSSTDPYLRSPVNAIQIVPR